MIEPTESAGPDLVLGEGIVVTGLAHAELQAIAGSASVAVYPLKSEFFDTQVDRARVWAVAKYGLQGGESDGAWDYIQALEWLVTAKLGAGADGSPRPEAFLMEDGKEKRVKVSGPIGDRAVPRRFSDDQYAKVALRFLEDGGLLSLVKDDQVSGHSVHGLAVSPSKGPPSSYERIVVAVTRAFHQEPVFGSNAIVRLAPDTGEVEGINIKNWLPVQVGGATEGRARSATAILTELVEDFSRYGTPADELVVDTCIRGWRTNGERLLQAVQCQGELYPVGDGGQVESWLVAATVDLVEAADQPAPQIGGRGVAPHYPDPGPWEKAWGSARKQGIDAAGRVVPDEVMSIAALDASPAIDATANAFRDTWLGMYSDGVVAHLDCDPRVYSQCAFDDLDEGNGIPIRETFTSDPTEEALDLDRFDLAWFAGSGCSNCVAGQCPRAQRHCIALGPVGRVYASPSEASKFGSLGNSAAKDEFSEDLEWVGFSSSSLLTPYSYDLPCADCADGAETRNNPFEEWAGTFGGLHGALGFATSAYPDQRSVVEDFAVYAAYPFPWGVLHTVRSAYVEAILDNWEMGVKRCRRSTHSESCDLSCPDGKSHCCPDDSSVFETTFYPGLPGSLVVERNGEEYLDQMESDCRTDDESCSKLKHYLMTGHQACEVWKDD